MRKKKKRRSPIIAKEKKSMIDETEKNQIKNMLSEYLNTITEKKSNKFICPLCKSGSGNNGNYTPALSVSGDKWHCFSCNNGGDIFTLIALQNGLNAQKDFKEIINIAKSTLHISSPKENQLSPEKINYAEFLSDCKQEVGRSNYYKKRGISAQTVKKFNLGYLTGPIIAKYKKTCKLEPYFAEGDIIIPYGGTNNYFIARETKTKPNEKSGDKHIKWKKPRTQHAGKEPIFNQAELYKAVNEPIFITEAPLDSISIEQVGGSSIAIGGTGQKKLETALKGIKNFNRPMIIAFDNPNCDKAGKIATEKLKEYLDTQKINYMEFEYPADIKDCNEYLMTYPEKFQESVHRQIAKIKEIAFSSRGQTFEGAIGSFKGAFKTFLASKRVRVSTGFKKLDIALNGGITDELYILGAETGQGKSALMMNIAENIALQGTPVIYYALEMSKRELVARGISSISKQMELAGLGQIAYTSGDILYHRYDELSGEFTQLNYHNYEKAMTEYFNRYGENLIIQEGNGIDMTVENIEEYVKNFIDLTGKKPVLFIDYIQMLLPNVSNVTLSDRKSRIDNTVRSLKKMSLDLEIPILAISSLNRIGYGKRVGLSSFKESGDLEYTSGVLLGLNLEVPTAKADTQIIEKATNPPFGQPRKMLLEIIKFRNGKRNVGVHLDYYYNFNLFREPSEIIHEHITNNFNPFEPPSGA